MVRSDAAPMNSRPPRIARGGWLDALRFIVGALIILYHFREASPVPLPQLHPVFDRGYLLTDFFIIDSGYVLARIYGDRLAAGQASLRAYARQRLLRVGSAARLWRGSRPATRAGSTGRSCRPRCCCSRPGACRAGRGGTPRPGRSRP